MRNVEIIGYGKYLPQNTINIDGQIRYRAGEGETQLTMAIHAIRQALEQAHMDISQIDLIVAASAVDIQPIPCTAALIHEQIAKGSEIPAMDINTTCTSFITALDTISYLIEAGRYHNVLIVSSELASLGLNPNQKESFELFSDAAAAVIVSKSRDSQTGILYAVQKTWSEGAHATEIRGGLTGFHPKYYSDKTRAEYMFDMKGIEVLSLAAKKLPLMFEECYQESGLSMEDIDMVVPHQASKALSMVMKRCKIPEGKYINKVGQFGNMVSASVPVAMIDAIENGEIKKGNVVMLCGTAAGLTTNILVMRY
ncbi:MAG: 3-oxoacyl-ACP synthase [Lachnospiraceae bacterium]|nr:3-oxoacyl-ACP synthase [Lachnospiraceae bacterium]